jgi:hypothetical protein
MAKSIVLYLESRRSCIEAGARQCRMNSGAVSTLLDGPGSADRGPRAAHGMPRRSGALVRPARGSRGSLTWLKGHVAFTIAAMPCNYTLLEAVR